MYISKAEARFSPTQLAALTTQASANNATLGITGALVYCNGHFIQVLEGQRSEVWYLYWKISLDRRHADMRILSLEMIDSRLFSDWGMSFVHEDCAFSGDRTRMEKLFAIFDTVSLATMASVTLAMFEKIKRAADENCTRARMSKTA